MPTVPSPAGVAAVSLRRAAIATHATRARIGVISACPANHAELRQPAEPAGGRDATPGGRAAQGAGIFIVAPAAERAAAAVDVRQVVGEIVA